MTTVAVVGMTHLGLVSGSAIAAKGFRTICFDLDKDLIEDLKSGNLPVSEPDLEGLISNNSVRQVFSSHLKDLASADLVYIAPDVPTDDTGASDLSGIVELINTVIPHLSHDAVLVVLCQVPPGFTRSIDRSPDYLCYQVETLVFGRAVERAMEPERFIVGLADAAMALPAPLKDVLSAFDCPLLPMRYESAELAKISINMCLVASISVANTMAELCEHVGADWSEIAPSLKLDRRIGVYSYLTPGLGIAGGNLERDLATVVRLGDAHDTDTGVVAAQISNSARRKRWAALTVRRLGLEKARLAVWGLAYKENTHSVKNSPSLATLAEIPQAEIVAHDPQVAEEAAPGVVRVADPLSALSEAEALLIMTPWPDYRNYSPETIRERLQGRVVIDPYRVLDRQEALKADLVHHTLGIGA